MRQVSGGGEGQLDWAGLFSSYSFVDTFPCTLIIYSGSLGMALVCVNLNALKWKILEDKI